MDKYLTFEPHGTNGTFSLMFNAKLAYADGVIKCKLPVDKRAVMHVEISEGGFMCDDDDFSEFATMEEAQAFMLAAVPAFVADYV